MSVITFSRQYGSGGDEVARLVSKQLGYAMFDKNLLYRAAYDSGLSDQEVIDYSEESYKVKNFFDRLFGRSRTVATISVWREGSDGVRLAEPMALKEEHVLALVRKAVQTAYQIGNMVIIGRGGQVILRGYTNILHVRIEAQLEDRIIHVREQHRSQNRIFPDMVAARRAAQDEIEAADAASADYLRRFYGVTWSDPALYHLVLNTSLMSVEQAAHLVIEASRVMEAVPEPA